MKDDKANEIARGPADTEGELRRLVPKPAPPGLRQKALSTALEVRMNSALTPRMRAVAAVCSMLIVAVLGVDPLIRRHESAEMAALLGGRDVLKPAGEDARLLWVELGGDLGDLDKFLGERIVLSRLRSREGSSRAYFEAQDRLKGMIDHEDPENYY